MRIGVIHNEVGEDDAPDERDVLIQAESIAQTLASFGHFVDTIACGLDLANVRNQLIKMNPDLIFNLVEALEGCGRFIHFFPSLLDTMAIPYTGSSAESLFMSSNKVLAKERMKSFGLPTPEWTGPYPGSMACMDKSMFSKHLTNAWIVKSVWEHASIGLDENGLVKADNSQLLFKIMKERVHKLGGACFAEHFIQGREFNLSLLSGPDGPKILPAAEIVFDGYTPDKPRIVGYRAKWDESSYEFHHTSRTFQFDNNDAILISQLKTLALRCWEIFGLKGYARVDFRADVHGQPWILEINANPCLTPDAGFAAAALQAGITYKDLIRQIVEDALYQKRNSFLKTKTKK